MRNGDAMTTRGWEDALDATARCLPCDTPVHEEWIGGEACHLECHPSPDGDFALIAGRWQRLPAGAMVAVGVMRFNDHKRVCKASLRVSESEKPTRPERPRNIRRGGR